MFLLKHRKWNANKTKMFKAHIWDITKGRKFQFISLKILSCFHALWSSHCLLMASASFHLAGELKMWAALYVLSHAVKHCSPSIYPRVHRTSRWLGRTVLWQQGGNKTHGSPVCWTDECISDCKWGHSDPWMTLIWEHTLPILSKLKKKLWHISSVGAGSMEGSTKSCSSAKSSLRWYSLEFCHPILHNG